MHWTDTTHSYTLSTCKHLGRPCPAAEHMLSRLAAALGQARTVTADDFEVAGNCELTACDHPCQARFTANHERIRIYCGVSPEAEQSGLDRFADALFEGTRDRGFIAKRPEYPYALAQAVPLHPQTSRTAASQQSLSA
ncbi:hypothetical protein [Phaeobacter porticola]|uniref:Uncharacterized protein n=1 Tax=Phaeobacter porticola TaxID=1844006 RepID=A0A1L3I1E7_9RHOB|nr:hypothetical protein [Phaeobacter porticola]APG45928.1 hypothetical protein PhaeoP97_00481 [Phaeobacter porticola]